MAKTVSDQILERLAAWGVTHVFGYPGDGINGLLGAFNADDHGITFIQARHEEMAAFMAVGYAKFTGRLGVCLATSGPGAIHLLNGLYDAKMDHQPVGALLPYLERKAERGWQRKIERAVAEWWKLMEDRAHVPARPLNPQRVFWELSPRLPDRVILTSDSGSAANWFARDLRLRTGMMATISGSLATMGCGVPYAIGAKFAHPDRPVMALVGDGAMQMNGNAELLTIKHYWRRWKDPRLVVLVLHNNDLNQVTWEMRAMEGDTRYAASQELPDFEYARYAELCGLRGIRVDHPDQLGAAWDEALASDRPCLVEAIVDPDVPPLPPHITLAQAKAFGLSLLKGELDEGGIIKQALTNMFPGLAGKE